MKYKYSGLSNNQVIESRKKNGTNTLPSPEIENFFDKLKKNFKDPLIVILCIALLLIIILSIFHLTEWYEAVGIAIAVVLAVFVSTFSEYKNEESFQKLQKEASMIKIQVFRNSSICEVFIDDIVVGDYVLLQSGVKVPADGILIEGLVKVNQASLTGESEALTKKPDKDKEVLDLMDSNSLFRGSVIEDGEGVMLVKRVGENSFYGKLSKELSISDNSLSPLQIKLKALAESISKFGYIGASLIFLISLFDKVVVNNHYSLIEISNYFRNFGKFFNDIIQSLVFSVVLIVAAVPEGLPMMVAIVLSLNMRKLLNAKVLVRKLLGIETAGSLNILFSDKTGTITKGQLEVNYFFTADNTKFFSFKDIENNILSSHIAKSIVFNTSSFLSDDDKIIGGNSSERAILSFIDKEIIKNYQNENIKILNNLPFNSSIKYSATKVNEDGNIFTFLKGAPEIILKNCNKFIDKSGNIIIENNNFDNLINEIDNLAEQGYRLLALAFSNDKEFDLNNLSNNLIFLGILAVRDEIRKESYNSINKAINAGIQVVMITGDRKGTAISIAKEVGLIKNEEDIVLTSDEMNNLSDNDLEKILPKLRVIARALPTDKSRLVRISKRLGFVTGMTGDGVNDAPALKQADVSFAMGSGSEVSKEASDIVILDDNFNSIVNAILYGRNIFKSIRKFIIFQLTVNVSAVFISFIGAMLNIQPINVIQILWINVIMDTLAAIAFGGEPALERYLNEKPISKTENILNSYMKSAIFINSIFIIVVSFIFIKSNLFSSIFPDNRYLMTGFFNYFVFTIVINGFNARSEKLNIFEHIKENPLFIYVMSGILILQVLLTYIGGKLLNVIPLNLEQWLVIIFLSLLIIPFDMARKKIVKL
ncbi:MAG: calcium-translocating P-type ATPase, PMCA-type [Candidatus Sericytochromatia bacterium]|nr:MAG: calcium-translocating P-type ATPase, PMCA-type [Candidatus Sericytochromatia bacterium]